MAIPTQFSVTETLPLGVPTQFSVTNTRTAPISNPALPLDHPQTLDAENAQVTETNLIDSLSGSIVGAPSIYTADNAAIIDAPSNASARAKANISAPDAASAESKAAIDTPTNATSETAVTIPLPTELTSLAKAEVDSAVTIPAENKTAIGVPSAKTAESKAVVNAPTFTINATTEYEFNNSLDGWTAVNSPISAGAGFITIVGNQNVQLIRSSLGALNPAENYLLAITLRCTTATVNTTVEAFTANSQHGFSGSFKVQSESVELVQGVGETIYLNLAQITDFLQDGFTSIRIDPLASVVSHTYEILNISFGVYQMDDVQPKATRIIDSPDIIGAASKSSASGPSAASAESARSIDAPVEKTAQPKAATDAPTAASVLPAANIDAPDAATARGKVAASAPSTLSTTSATPLTPPFPLNHARILYDSVLESYSSITASSEAAGFPPINALKPNTYEAWRFTTSASTLQIDFGGPTRAFDMLCIGAHNLGRAGADIEVWYEPEPGGTFVQFDTTKSPVFDQQQHPIVFYSQTAVNALTIEVRITGASGVPSIGYISAGVALQMQRPFFNGHTPITDADVTQYYSNRTESGEIIGQQIRAQGYETSADWQNIDDAWYRTYFAPFKQAAKLRPFFFAWNLLEYPDDVGFCRIDQDISAPMQNGTRTKRSISMKLLGAG